jgi:hypothetical protein
MSGASERREWRLGLAVLLFLAGCGRHDDAAPTAPPAPSATPVDSLGPGELIPGDKRAFGLLLPRDVKVDQALTEVIFASGPVSASDLANYVRARVRDGTVGIGATATVFDQVRAVDDPTRLLFIRIISGPSGRGARIEVRNVTPRVAPELPNDVERWKQFGAGPDGKILDPQHLH